MIEQLDYAIEVLSTDPDAAIPNLDSSAAELLGVAAELGVLPRPAFGSRLKFQLTHGRNQGSVLEPQSNAFDVTGIVYRIKKHELQPVDMLPTLLTQCDRIYPLRRSNSAVSLAAHALALALILTSGVFLSHRQAADLVKIIAVDDQYYLPIVPGSLTAPPGGGRRRPRQNDDSGG